jgi:hypothetical protein
MLRAALRSGQRALLQRTRGPLTGYGPGNSPVYMGGRGFRSPAAAVAAGPCARRGLASLVIGDSPPPPAVTDLAAPSLPFRLSQNFLARYKDEPAPFGYNGLGELVYRWRARCLCFIHFLFLFFCFIFFFFFCFIPSPDATLTTTFLFFFSSFVVVVLVAQTHLRARCPCDGPVRGVVADS